MCQDQGFDPKKYLPDHSNWAMEYVERMGYIPFNQFLNKVYIYLDRMKRGESFDILQNVKPKNMDLFIKCAAQFMIDTAALTNESNFHTHSFYFTDDYKKIDRR